jgi:hypothetical protein
MLQQQDDLGDTDIMAYSAINAGGEDDDAIFSAGGAIMDALEQNQPGIKKEVLAQSAKKLGTQSLASKGGASKVNFKLQPVVVKGNKVVSSAISKNILAQQKKKAEQSKLKQ